MIRSAPVSGKINVVTPGTIIRATWALPVPMQHFAVHGILFQTLPENTGRVYIGGSMMVRTARTGLFAMLPVPTLTTLPTFSAAITQAPNALGLEEFYVDADNPGDGVIVCLLIL